MNSSPATIANKVLQTGLWHVNGAGVAYSPANFGGTKPDSHKFAFTDAPVTLPADTTQQMHDIAGHVPDYYQMLQDMGESLPAVGVSSQYDGLDLSQWTPPPVTMLDAMITDQGDVKIAEVDVINPRGLGYLVLEGLLHGTPHAEAALDAVQAAIQASGGQLTVLQGSLQGFYEPYYRLLQTALQRRGVGCELTAEAAIAIQNGQLLVDGQPWQPQTLLDFPILKKATKKSYGPLSAWIINAYTNSALAMLYPPQPQLSSKLLLAQASAQGVFGDSLPETTLCTDTDTAHAYLAGGKHCVKTAVSSGMKGLWMPGSAQPLTAKAPVVAQRLIDDQAVLELTHASGHDPDWKLGNFLARLSLFVSADGQLLAADITGQPYTGEIVGVHGNPDCVLAPVAL